MSGKKLTNRRKSSISVCYLIDVSPEKFQGGGQTHLTNLVRELKRSDLEYSRSDLLIFAGPSPITLIRFLWIFWVIPQVIFNYLFRQKFSLIHAHSVPAMAAGKILSLVLGIPIVVTVHGSLVSNQESPGEARKLLARFLEKWILTKVKYDAQITVSRNFLEVPNVNKNMMYIPNGVDVGKFAKLHTPLRSFANLTILFVGRKNDSVKGFRILEEAMKLVRLEISGAKLMIADGSIPEAEVVKMYRQADLFVLPSSSEGFPLTLLEAWAAKLPVVVTAVGEVPYLVKDGVNGYLVSPGEVGSLAEAIIAALKNPDLAKLGENGYNLAKEYTWERAARKTLRVYQKIC